ncbi:hypothetical protein ART_3470 [Arthrobacter sp. PAMC 25486]|nr:hypothetical protein ART_3470 [Arthrobacter sp. PAMC 25486]
MRVLVHTITELVLEKNRLLSNTVLTEISAAVTTTPATGGYLQPSPDGDSYFRLGGVPRTGYDPGLHTGGPSGRNNPFRAQCVE